MSILITCGIAILGSYLGKKAKLPASRMIGAIVLVAACNLSFGLAPIPLAMRTMTQVIAGAFIGAGLTTDSLLQMRRLLKPASISIIGLFGVNILLGLLLHYLGGLDLCTALFSSTPGGLSEMLIISEDMGADISYVTIFQLSRMILTIFAFPFLITHVMKIKKTVPEPSNITASYTRFSKGTMDISNNQALKNEQKSICIFNNKHTEFLVTMFFATISGFLGKWSGFPGGALLFSAISAAVLKLHFHIGVIPSWAKKLAQTIVGAYVGAKLTPDIVASVTQLWPYIALIVITYLVFCIIAAKILAQITILDEVTAAFSCAPSGSSDMALIAADFDVDTSHIAVLQMVRFIAVVTFGPSLITVLLKLQEFLHF